jgi:hypothetical protein
MAGLGVQTFWKVTLLDVKVLLVTVSTRTSQLGIPGYAARRAGTHLLLLEISKVTDRHGDARC